MGQRVKIEKPFFVDPKNPGVVRGGFYDEMGGMLVGVHAKWVCETLNEKRERDSAGLAALDQFERAEAVRESIAEAIDKSADRGC
jgi:hypothetical protein